MEKYVAPAMARSSHFDGPSTINPQLRSEVRILEEQAREARKKRIEVEVEGILLDLVKLGCPRQSLEAMVRFANTYCLGHNGVTFGRARIAEGGFDICLNLEDRYFPIVFVSWATMAKLALRFPQRSRSLARSCRMNRVVRPRVKLAA